MGRYDHKLIEAKWREKWDEEGVDRTGDPGNGKKCYILDMFPYPSGHGLHVGHPLGYVASDVVSRKRRMEGYAVLHPMGWDAFGLPAENFAIKTGTPPDESTRKNIVNMRRQFRMIGNSYDWDREITTCDPAYYRWTQWLFLYLYEKGLAYKKKSPVNWCGSCQTVLANEQVIDGACERCDSKVVQRDLEQWFFKVTAYADRLLADLEKLEWPEKILLMQKNWIGKSEGAEIVFKGDGFDVPVFTTRPDTLFGVEYVVLAPEHALVNEIVSDAQRKDVEAYVKKTAAKSELERTGTDQDKSGVPLGVAVTHPLTGKDVPLWIADYALVNYGTGAVMGVPAHDDRDRAFAEKHGLPVTTVIEPVSGEPQKDPEFRRSIVAIVENPEDGSILTLDWGPDLGGTLLIGGGRDEDEDPEACARREILEETGYEDLELVGVSETIHHSYFAHSKNVARQIDAIGLHFRLKSDKRNEAALEEDEKGKFTVQWLPREEAASKVVEALHAYVFAKFIKKAAYTGTGIMVHSGEFDGMPSAEAKKAITEALEKKGLGAAKTNWRIRDWLISRQRYWGAPIPIIYCEDCGAQPVPEKDLPVLLPEDVDFRPTGESPLARSESFHDVKCPECGKDARRESDTMDTFVDSSWYFLRYASPHDGDAPFSQHDVATWCPVDLYVGGAEHAVLHLLYSRFVTKALFDGGMLGFDEPFLKLRNPGMILGENMEKMSKSRGNVVNPDDVVETDGADAFRVYEMFMGDFTEHKPWNTQGLGGARRFLDRLWTVAHDTVHEGRDEVPDELERLLHKTIKKVGADIEDFKFNTAVSQLMILTNEWIKSGKGSKAFAGTVVTLLAPFAPFLSEELWRSLLGHEGSVLREQWPSYDEKKTVDASVTMIVQVNGKVRDKFEIAAGTDDAETERVALQRDAVKAALSGAEPKRVIVIKDKLVNIVV